MKRGGKKNLVIQEFLARIRVDVVGRLDRMTQWMKFKKLWYFLQLFYESSRHQATSAHKYRFVFFEMHKRFVRRNEKFRIHFGLEGVGKSTYESASCESILCAMEMAWQPQ